MVISDLVILYVSSLYNSNSGVLEYRSPTVYRGVLISESWNRGCFTIQSCPRFTRLVLANTEEVMNLGW